LNYKRKRKKPGSSGFPPEPGF